MAEVTKRLVVGIDPGSQTGIAEYDRESKRIERVVTTNFWDGFDFILEHYDATGDHAAVIIIEAPVKTAMYARQQKVADGKSKGYGNRMMSNAAGSAREAELLADGLERAKFEVIRVRPKRHKNAEGIAGKITAAEVKELTGWEHSTNQHTRDAIMLCFGK